LPKLPEDDFRTQRGYRARLDGPLSRKLAGLPPRAPNPVPAIAASAPGSPQPVVNTSAESVEKINTPREWPTADLVAFVSVAVCRAVGVDVLKMMRGAYPDHHPARVYVFHGLRSVFPGIDDVALARLTGIKFGSWGIKGRRMGKFGPTSERIKYGVWNRRAEDAAKAAIEEFRTK